MAPDLSKPDKEVCPTKQCSSCFGVGRIKAFVDGRDASGRAWGDLRSVTCLTCEGEGVITAERAERMEAGSALRRERVLAGKTLREAADEMGISCAELSAIERGKSRPTCSGAGTKGGE